MLPFVMRGAAFIKFDGVDGEASAVAYEGWSELEAVNQVIRREVDPESGSIRTRANATFEDIVCEKILDKSSPKLAEAIALGRCFPRWRFI
jgi:type VI secretion system secreted protein Hcp